MPAMVDRRISTLNPNAPVFDPVVFREVEDFSPKWWDLVTNSKWFRDFWLSDNSENEFVGGDDFPDIEDEFEQMIASSDETEIGGFEVDTVTESDVARFVKALLNMAESKKGKVYRSKVSISSCSPKYKRRENYSFNCRRNHHIYQPR